MKRILIIGATSAIAKATARRWASEGNRIYLIGRDIERLKRLATDLVMRGANLVEFSPLDINAFDKHPSIIDGAIQAMGGIDIALIAHGTLGHQERCEQDFNITLKAFNTNAISVISLLTHLANRFEAQKKGTIAVISSVAGDRGRQSNYVYGAAKGAISIFLQGLRQRLHKSGVHVLTIKPGFVDTPMTQAFKKGWLWVSPEVVANLIVKQINAKNNVIYAPKYWAVIMCLITLIPEGFFKKMTM